MTAGPYITELCGVTLIELAGARLIETRHGGTAVSARNSLPSSSPSADCWPTP